MKREPFYLILHLLGGLVLLFIVAPLFGMVWHAAPDVPEAARDPEVTASILRTVGLAMAATLLLSVAAIPLAYVLARCEFPLKGLVNAAVNLPIVLPHTAAGIALLGVLTRGGWFGQAAESIGLRLINSGWGVMLAMAYVSVPFLVNCARDGFLAVPERLESVAMTLGASPARVFFTISLPLAWRGVLSGLVLMWSRGMSEFGAVVIVAYHPMIAPVLIYERLGAFGLKYARPVAVLMLGVCLLVLVLLRALLPKDRHVATR